MEQDRDHRSITFLLVVMVLVFLILVVVSVTSYFMVQANTERIDRIQGVISEMRRDQIARRDTWAVLESNIAKMVNGIDKTYLEVSSRDVCILKKYSHEEAQVVPREAQ